MLSTKLITPYGIGDFVNRPTDDYINIITAFMKIFKEIGCLDIIDGAFSKPCGRGTEINSHNLGSSVKTPLINWKTALECHKTSILYWEMRCDVVKEQPHFVSQKMKHMEAIGQTLILSNQ